MKTVLSTTSILERAFAAREALPRHTLGSAPGLSIELWPHGGVHAIRYGDLLINQWLAHPMEAGLNRLILRRRDGRASWTDIIGPASPSAFGADERVAVWRGAWEDLAYDVELHVDGERPLWFWRLRVTNRGAVPASCDALYGQDLALAAVGAVRNNEAYTSHYLDHTIEQHSEIGPVLLTRQNEAQGGAFPWVLQGCLTGAASFATDGFQFFGRSFRATGVPEACLAPALPSKRLQYEFAYAALQSRPVELPPGGSADMIFFACFEPDHPTASGARDLARVETARAYVVAARADGSRVNLQPPRSSLWQQAALLQAEDLTDDDVATLFGQERRHEERDSAERLSFFSDPARHVVLRAKELRVDRPHGMILRSGQSLFPEPDTLSVTCWAFGVFASQVTVGNTNFNKLLSVCRNPLNAIRTSGLRIFVRDGEGWKLLGVPSAFDMGPGSCRWLYKSEGRLWSVTVRVSAERPLLALSIEVLGGPTQDFMLAHDLVLGVNEMDAPCRMVVDGKQALVDGRPDPDGFTARHHPGLHFTLRARGAPASVGGAERLGDDPQARDVACCVVRTGPIGSFALEISGHVDADEIAAAAVAPSCDEVAPFVDGVLRHARIAGRAEAARLQDVLPWFAHHALVHLTVPHGLEQYSGAAWGTRDVCQGPVEFLLALGHIEPVRRILETVYAHQFEETAEWPQWFMFDAYGDVQQEHSHGDVIFWPLLALCDYVEGSNDTSIFASRVPYMRREGRTFVSTPDAHPLLNHVHRQLNRIESMFVPGTALVRYGDGDWDDTLQPADASMRTRMVSGWTVELCYQVMRRLHAAAARAGYKDLAARTERLADAVCRDFNRFFVRDGVAAGFLVGEADATVRALLHPQDRVTGIRYRLLPMTRGIISEIFTPDQARAHMELVRQHLLFPDGAHLMSDPAEYRGGLSRLFRRAETSAYFGREVSLQYTHAHIRYAEALAKLGMGAELLRALLAANPVALRETVRHAALRQSNTYFSSSDAAFADRYEAFARHGELREGRVPVKGGWRIYSSGPGIFVRQVIQHWLGLRESFGDLVLDPVLDRSLDGLVFSWRWRERAVTVRYHVASAGFGPTHVALNGRALTFTRDANPYRTGGARIPIRDLLAVPGDLVLDIRI